jgi:hypothetical protein
LAGASAGGVAGASAGGVAGLSAGFGLLSQPIIETLSATIAIKLKNFFMINPLKKRQTVLEQHDQEQANRIHRITGEPRAFTKIQSLSSSWIFPRHAKILFSHPAARHFGNLR